MIKITTEKFLQLFVQDARLLNAEDCVVNLTQKDVVEFQIGDKYIYKINDSSPFGRAHESLCNHFLNIIPVNNAAVAYRQGISYLNLFEPHQGGYYFLRLDISSFFHSIHVGLLRAAFSDHFKDDHLVDLYIDKKEEQTLLDAFIALVSYELPDESLNVRFKNKRVLPIGFKTSPVISNIIFRKLDIIIQKYCLSKDIVYSRYADDMLFSSSGSFKFIHSDSFYNEIKYLLSIDGFKVNKRKTIKREHTISLNGYVLSKDNRSHKVASIRISNKKTNIITKLLYMLGNDKSSEEILIKLFDFKVSPKYFNYIPPSTEYLKKYCDDQLLNKITGYRSYLISIIRFNGKYQCVNNSAVNKYIHLVESLNKYIN